MSKLPGCVQVEVLLILGVLGLGCNQAADTVPEKSCLPSGLANTTQRPHACANISRQDLLNGCPAGLKTGQDELFTAGIRLLQLRKSGKFDDREAHLASSDVHNVLCTGALRETVQCNSLKSLRIGFIDGFSCFHGDTKGRDIMFIASITQ